jgi:hypothetical protein
LNHYIDHRPDKGSTLDYLRDAGRRILSTNQPSKMGRMWYPAALTCLLAASLVSGEEAYTPRHEAGRCAIRGNCGKQSFFGSELPCSDNGLAKDPTEDVRKQLVGICGAKWNTGQVCCEAEQVCLCHCIVFLRYLLILK